MPSSHRNWSIYRTVNRNGAWISVPHVLVTKDSLPELIRDLQALQKEMQSAG